MKSPSMNPTDKEEENLLPSCERDKRGVVWYLLSAVVILLCRFRMPLLSQVWMDAQRDGLDTRPVRKRVAGQASELRNVLEGPAGLEGIDQSGDGMERGVEFLLVEFGL